MTTPSRPAHEDRQQHYAELLTDIRAGEAEAIVDPALAYLGRLYEVEASQPPIERLKSWLNADLAEEVLAGFEAVLHRRDLPSPEEIARQGANGTSPWIASAILAGLIERQRRGVGLADLDPRVWSVGLMLCQSLASREETKTLERELGLCLGSGGNLRAA